MDFILQEIDDKELTELSEQIILAIWHELFPHIPLPDDAPSLANNLRGLVYAELIDHFMCEETLDED